jgi:meso-butanediol dehydrogenase/(S,S)-butanediol dehydrogenase/diacetyl reductase
MAQTEGMNELENKAYLVTGAGRGLGRAITLEAIAAGATIGAMDLDPKLLEQLAQDAGPGAKRLVILPGDVASREQVMNAAATLAGTAHGIDGLVSNAALIHYEPIDAVTEQTLDRMLAIGIKGAVWGAQALLAHRRAGGTASLIHMTSPTAERGAPRTSVYAMTKAAVASLTRTLAVELGPQGIRVNALSPGSIPTPGAMGLTSKEEYARRAATIPLRRLGTEREVALAALYLLSDAASFINGEVLHIDGGLMAGL